MTLHLATPEHHTHFAQWRDCDRLERLTCRPIVEEKEKSTASCGENGKTLKSVSSTRTSYNDEQAACVFEWA